MWIWREQSESSPYLLYCVTIHRIISCLNSYRAFVLRALPNLKKLDNVEVTPDEVEEAMRRDIRISAPAGNQQPEFEAEQNHHNQQDWQETSPSREVCYFDVNCSFVRLSLSCPSMCNFS